MRKSHADIVQDLSTMNLSDYGSVVDLFQAIADLPAASKPRIAVNDTVSYTHKGKTYTGRVVGLVRGGANVQIGSNVWSVPFKMLTKIA